MKTLPLLSANGWTFSWLRWARKIVVSSPKEDVSEVVLSSNFGAKYVDTRSN